MHELQWNHNVGLPGGVPGVVSVGVVAVDVDGAVVVAVTE